MGPEGYPFLESGPSNIKILNMCVWESVDILQTNYRNYKLIIGLRANFVVLDIHMCVGLVFKAKEQIFSPQSYRIYKI